MADQGKPPTRGPVELEVLRFEGTLGSLGALRDQPEPDIREAQLIAVACEAQLRAVTASTGPIAAMSLAIRPDQPETLAINYEEAYSFTLFPVFFASMRAGGSHGRLLAVCLLVYSRLPFRQLAMDTAGQPEAFDRTWPPDRWEAVLSGLFVTYARAFDRDAGQPGMTVGHAASEWITGIQDRDRTASAAKVAANWLREQIDLWSRRIHEDFAEPSTDATVATGSTPGWISMLPPHIELTSTQIIALEDVRCSVGVSEVEFGVHLASHPECSKMAQRAVFAALKEQLPGVPDELVLSVLLHTRLQAARMSGDDLFDLAGKAPFATQEPTEAELGLLVATLRSRRLTTLDEVIAAVAEAEKELPHVPPSLAAAAAVVRVSAILRRSERHPLG